MATFQEFVQTELPLRQVVIFGSFNPTISGQNASIGSYFLDNSVGSGPYIRYEKIGSNSTDWRIVPPSATDISGLNTIIGSYSAIWNNNVITTNTVSTVVYETLYSNIDSTKNSLQEYISYEWNPHIVKHSSTIKLANGKIYMLATSDGSSTTHYLEMNLRPISPFFTSTIVNYGTVDSYNLNEFKSCKYTIEVNDAVLNKTHYSEINVLSDGIEVAVSEYGTLFTSTNAMVEYGGYTNGTIVSLTAISLIGSMNDKTFKGIRTNFF
jgi:hypothetical protein